MAFLKSAVARLSGKHTPIHTIDMPLDSWCHVDGADPTRFVQKVEICTALATGEDAWGTPVGAHHPHTLLRVWLSPIPGSPSGSQDNLFVERVLSTGGAHHSVTPITETFSKGGTLFHPNVHDRVCIVTEGPATGPAQDLKVERIISFGDSVCLALDQFAQILSFVSRTTTLICAGGDCKFQSRSFAFMCMAALTPTLPPPRLVSTDVEPGAERIEDSVFELSAEAFLAQVPWLVRDSSSMQALKLIGELKDESRGVATMRLYH